jgi:hypothetical protein
MTNVPGEPTARRSDEWFECRDLDGFRTRLVDDAVTYL